MLAFDHNSHFELQTDDSALTYRMLQVIQDDEGQSHIVEGSAINAVSMPLSESATPGTLASGSSAKVYAQSSGGKPGQYFVMMSPNELTQSSGSQRMGRTGAEIKMSQTSLVIRDDRRKATHKEVERRRRDKINTWISQLAQLVPDCTGDVKLTESKCAVLSKACDYITSLQNANDSLAISFDEVTVTTADITELRRQYNQLQAENRLLWTELHNNGIEPPGMHSEIALDD
jgi:upstream stimulatory factor